MDDKQSQLKRTDYFVEASSFERSTLWRDWAKEATNAGLSSEMYKDRQVDWQQQSLGYGQSVGELDGRPVYISLNWATINGRQVMFWEPTSVVVDHDMIEEWLKENLPDGIEKSNAENFHNCVLWINRKNKEAA